MWGIKFGIRSRVLAIALVPSFALLTAGIGVSEYLIQRGARAEDWSRHVDQSTSLGVVYIDAMQQERGLSLLQIAGDRQVTADLGAARRQADQSIMFAGNENALAALDPGLMARMVVLGAPLATRMPGLRRQVDADTASPTDVYAVWTGLLDFALDGMDLIARTAPDVATSVAESKARSTLYADEALARAAALGAPTVVHGSTTAAQLPQLVTEVGSYRASVNDLTSQLQGAQLTALRAMMATPAWQRFNSVEDTLIGRGADAHPDSTWAPDVGQWQSDAAQIGRQMLDIYYSQQRQALATARAGSAHTRHDSIRGGGAALGVSLVAFAVAIWLSGRLIRRLERLRGQTLVLADEHLPDLIDRLRGGEPVDLDSALARLDLGRDEIGQLGDAVNRAQVAAVLAALTQTRTMESAQAMFLNIAHRSQEIAHQLLEILYRAEYETDDPGQLDLLFQLDHLATRERRNAENLIILGGEQPGRRWSNPVRLSELVRGAVAETEDYTRVRSVRLPDLHIVGTVVADLIHLLAELVDNATFFSPPESLVEVSGNIVGNGVAVEVTDQGCGLNAAELDRLNETLSTPADFGIDALSVQTHLGLCLVARLAARNDISVRLTPSDYSGTKAIVVIPSALIATDAPISPGADSGLPRRTPQSAWATGMRRGAIDRVEPI